MDAHGAQETPEIDLPRHLFFGVEDRRLGGRAGLEDKYLSMERARQQLAQHVIDTAIQVANAVRTMRTFDRTGNADQAIDHLNASLDDLDKYVRSLTSEVEKSVDRYGDGLDAIHARDAAEARAALNAPAAGEPSPQGSPVAGLQPAAAAKSPQPAAAAGPKPGPIASFVQGRVRPGPIASFEARMANRAAATGGAL